MTMATLRTATRDDIPTLCELGRVMHAESSFAPMDFDAEILAGTIGRLIDQRQFVAVVESTDGEVVGGMLGLLSPSFFGKDFVANDIALFIHPYHRRGTAAARLLHAFEAWAKAGGCRQVRPGVSTGSATAERLIEGMGFERVGGVFCKTLERSTT